MKENFDRAFEFTVGHEGGYVNDPDDPGGETKFGISKKYHPEVDIKNLTIEQAKMIYYKEYWALMKCDEIPYPLDILVFDSAVNPGPGAASAFLSKSSGPHQFILERIAYYVDIADKYEIRRKFFRGWVNRTIKLYRQFKEDK